MISVSIGELESGGNDMLPKFILNAVIASILVSLVAGTLGTYAVLRRVSFLVAGAAHAALGGAALFIVLATYLNISWLHPFLGGLMMALAMAMAAGYAGGKGATARMEAAISVFFAFSLSIAVALISLIPSEFMGQVWGLLIGDILLLTEIDVIVLMLVTTLVISLSILFFREFTYICFDIEGSMAFGMRATLYNYLLLSLIAISTVVATKAVGAIVVYAILTAPSATALLIAKTIEKAILLSTLLSLTYLLCSLVISLEILPVAPGALAGIIASSIYLLLLSLIRIRRRRLASK